MKKLLSLLFFIYLSIGCTKGTAKESLTDIFIRDFGALSNDQNTYYQSYTNLPEKLRSTYSLWDGAILKTRVMHTFDWNSAAGTERLFITRTDPVDVSSSGYSYGHSEGPALSFYLWDLTADKLKLSSQYYLTGGSFGEPPAIRSVQYGKDKWGFSEEASFTGQGTTMSGYTLHAVVENNLQTIFSCSTHGDNRGMFSEDETDQIYDYDAGVTFKASEEHGGAWDITVSTRGKIRKQVGEREYAIVPADKSTDYHFDGKKYNEVIPPPFPKGFHFPKALGFEKKVPVKNFPDALSYSTFEEIHLIGFSKKGKIAFIREEKNNDGRGVGADLKFYVIDLVSDKELFHRDINTVHYFDKEMVTPETGELALAWKEISFSDVLINEQIIETPELELKSFPCEDKDGLVEAGVAAGSIFINNPKGTKKIGGTAETTAQNTQIAGYLKSPFEPRLAVITALIEERQDWEHQDSGYNHFRAGIIGASLTAGFK